MDLHTWIDEKSGRAAWIAEKLKVTPSAVSQWRGSGVPAIHMSVIADITANDVTVEEMLSHSYKCAISRKKPATQQVQAGQVA